MYFRKTISIQEHFWIGIWEIKLLSISGIIALTCTEKLQDLKHNMLNMILLITQYYLFIIYIFFDKILGFEFCIHYGRCWNIACDSGDQGRSNRNISSNVR